MRYVALYNTQFPQSALGSRTPVQAMKDQQKSNPDLFAKNPRNRPGCDSYVKTTTMRYSESNRESLGCKQSAL